MSNFIEFFKSLSSAGWGNSAYETLFYLCVALIFLKEKNKYKKITFGYYPLIIMIGIYNPITVLFATKVFGTDLLIAYYCRMFMMMPIAFCIAYGLIIILRGTEGRKKMFFSFALALIIIISGKCVYSEDWFIKADNFNKIPNDVIELSALINEEATIMVPNDLSSYVRQYDSRLHLAYGRYAANEKIAIQVSSDNPDINYIVNYGKEHDCEYVVCLNKQDIIDGFIASGCFEYGYTDNYVIIQLEYNK